MRFVGISHMTAAFSAVVVSNRGSGGYKLPLKVRDDWWDLQSYSEWYRLVKQTLGLNIIDSQLIATCLILQLGLMD